MSDLKLALTYLRSRPLVTILTIASVALGLALATVVLLVTNQAETVLESETANWDVVVGAKGSPLQLVLNSLYYLDAPVGNVSTSVWRRLQTHPGISSVIPVNMGDNYSGWPIIGTTLGIFTGKTAARGGSLISAGRNFEKPFEAVVGSDIAKRNHVHLGMTLIGAHGWGKSNDLHPKFPYTVVGILAQTGGSLDRAIYTDYRSTWIVHSHPDADEKTSSAGHDPSKEVTALLVRFSQPGRRYLLVQEINRNQPAMAVIPVDEISRLVMSFIAPMRKMMIAVSYLVVIVSGLTILISLYLMIYQRRRDIAVLRALGATRADVFRLVTIEAAMLAGLGVLSGWVLGHGAIAVMRPFIAAHFGISPNEWQTSPAELVIIGTVWALGIIAGLLPAAIAYRLPVADSLTTE